MMGKKLKGLNYYIKGIKNRNFEVEEEFKSEYQSVVHIIINKDPYSDKITNLSILVHEILLSFINAIKTGQVTESSQTARILKKIIKNHIKKTIHLQLKQLCQDLFKGSPEAEKRIWGYEINVLKVIEKYERNKYLPCYYHTNIARVVIIEFLSKIKEGGKDIRNFYSFLNIILHRRMIDQYRKETHMMLIEDQDDLSYLPSSNYNPEDEWINRIDFEILSNFIERKLNPIEKYIIMSSYYQKKKLRDIAKNISVLENKKISEPTVCRIRKGALKKLRDMFKRKGVVKVGT